VKKVNHSYRKWSYIKLKWSYHMLWIKLISMCIFVRSTEEEGDKAVETVKQLWAYADELRRRGGKVSIPRTG
jgi:hypothetical protein